MLIIIILLSTTVIITINVKAATSTVTGTVYLDEIPTKPDQLKLVLPTQTVTLPDDGSTYGQIYDDGYYMIKALKSEQIGSVGTFYATFDGNTYTAPEKLTIQNGVSYYEIDLFFGEYYEPEEPELPPEEPVEDNTPTNTQPISNPGGPYTGTVGTPIQFDGSASSDPDGSITKYEWNFGEIIGATGPTPMHTYEEEGKYTVTLKVTDNQGKAAQTSTYALITISKPNNPPNKPRLTGTTTWIINNRYNKITVESTDPDNDQLRYIISWGDNTNATTTILLPNETNSTLTHDYTEPGVYTITAYAIDVNNAPSEATNLTILVNIRYVGTVGYLIANTNNGNYDRFYSNLTKNTTFVQQNNNIILIDSDNDGILDHEYNIITDDLSAYSAPQQTSQQTSPLTFDMIILLTAFFVIILEITLYIIVIRKRQQFTDIAFPDIATPKPDQIYYMQKTHKTPETDTETVADIDVYKPKTAASSETPDEQFDEIRRKIDEAILKNEMKNNQ